MGLEVQGQEATQQQVRGQQIQDLVGVVVDLMQVPIVGLLEPAPTAW